MWGPTPCQVAKLHCRTMSTGVIAVVSHFWPTRRKYLPEIVEAFHDQTVRPDDIVVWNNGPEPLEPMVGATVINSTQNYGARAKWVAAVAKPSPYYIMNDDDIKPRTRSIEHYLNYATPGCALATHGMIMTNKRLSRGTDVNGNHIDKPVRVHAFNGCQQFTSIEAIGKMFAAEAAARCNIDDHKYLYNADDILIAMVNDPALVVPVTAEECGYETVDREQIESMNGELGYVAVRNMLAWRWWQQFKGKPLPGSSPIEQDKLDVYETNLAERLSKRIFED